MPGTLATWETPLDEWGTTHLRAALRPPTRLARRGFIVDETFQGQVEDNRPRFEAFTPTARLFLTIEQIGGSGIVVPGRGFLLNNELTDFSAVYDPQDPNRIEGGKRPRSSMAPTIVLENGEPYVALGSPGRVDDHHDGLADAVQPDRSRHEHRGGYRGAAGQPTQHRRRELGTGFYDTYGTALEAYGHSFSETEEIGAATAIRFSRQGRVTAVAEPVRRGGGSALVVWPRR